MGNENSSKDQQDPTWNNVKWNCGSNEDDSSLWRSGSFDGGSIENDPIPEPVCHMRILDLDHVSASMSTFNSGLHIQSCPSALRQNYT